MSLNLQEGIDRVYRLVRDLERPTLLADIESAKKDALQALGSHCGLRGNGLLQKEFSITMTSGVADLTAFSDATVSQLLIDHVEWVKHPTLGRMSHVEHKADLDNSNYTNFSLPRYAIHANTICGRLDNGTSFPPNGVLTVSSYYVPALAATAPEFANVPGELEDDLISIWAMRVRSMPAQQEAA